MGAKEGLHFSLQVWAAGAAFRQKRRSIGRGARKGLVKEGLEISPGRRTHRAASPVRSRRSQALATIHCRFTVAAETPIASAVSSIVNPPK